MAIRSVRFLLLLSLLVFGRAAQAGLLSHWMVEPRVGWMPSGKLAYASKIVTYQTHGLFLGGRAGLGFLSGLIWGALDIRTYPELTLDDPNTAQTDHVWQAFQIGGVVGVNLSPVLLPCRLWIGWAPWDYLYINQDAHYYSGSQWKWGGGYFLISGLSFNLEYSLVSFGSKKVANQIKQLTGPLVFQGSRWEVSLSWVFGV